jgi:hypothetical protein
MLSRSVFICNEKYDYNFETKRDYFNYYYRMANTFVNTMRPLKRYFVFLSLANYDICYRSADFSVVN